jgi:predicted tellurium resistance membrane protein TerC
MKHPTVRHRSASCRETRQLLILFLGLILSISQLSFVSRTPSDWHSSKGIAKSMLRDRVTRRRTLGYALFVVLAWLGIGMWGIDEWLAGSAMRFLVWCSVCMLLTLMLVIFALYDALRVIREERSKREL